MCNSDKIQYQFTTYKKDMCQEGYNYVQCFKCASFYLSNLNILALKKFYAETDYYESSSSKNDIINQLSKVLKLTGRESIIDLGCGTGAWSLPILSYCKQINCVDLNNKNLERLKKRIPYKKSNQIKCYNLDSMEFLSKCDDNSFDGVLSMWNLEHDTEPARLVKEVYRVLKPDGFMLVLVPSADSLQVKLLKGSFYWFQAPWHTFIPSNKGLASLGKQAGFSVGNKTKLNLFFNGWYWLRSLADLSRKRKLYDRLRKVKFFVYIDILLDKLMDKLSHFMHRPSHVFHVFIKDN